MEIAISRTGAIGDVILATPVVREAHRIYKVPYVTFRTSIPAVLEGNPLIRRTASPDESLRGFDLLINLDGAYEMRPHMHIIDAYSIVAFGTLLPERSTDLFWSEDDQQLVDDLLAVNRISLGAAVVVHPARSWENRTFGTLFWNRVCAGLTDLGLRIFLVGTRHDVPVSDLAQMVRLTDRLTINQIGCLLSRAACFVGPDSAILHVAGTTRVPIVGLFTAARAELRLPYRRGRFGYMTTALRPSLDCYGCLHRQPAPAAYCGCERGDLLCLVQINPRKVVEAAEQLIHLDQTTG